MVTFHELVAQKHNISVERARTLSSYVVKKEVTRPEEVRPNFRKVGQFVEAFHHVPWALGVAQQLQYISEAQAKAKHDELFSLRHELGKFKDPVALARKHSIAPSSEAGLDGFFRLGVKVSGDKPGESSEPIAFDFNLEQGEKQPVFSLRSISFTDRGAVGKVLKVVTKGEHGVSSDEIARQKIKEHLLAKLRKHVEGLGLHFKEDYQDE